MLNRRHWMCSLMFVFVTLGLIGCAGVSQQDLDQMNNDIRSDLNNRIDSKFHDLEQKVLSVEDDLLTLKKLKKDVKDATEKIDQKTAELEKMTNTAREESLAAQRHLLTILKSQKRTLHEQLNVIQVLINKLKTNVEAENVAEEPSESESENTSE